MLPPIRQKPLSTFSRYWYAILAVTSALLLFTAVYRGALHAVEAQEGGKSEHELPKAQSVAKTSEKKSSSTEEPEAPGGVTTKGYLSRDSAGPRGKVRFWIAVRNGTKTPITGLRFVDFYVPGFDRPEQLSGGCAGATWNQICSALPAGASVTLWGDLSVSANEATKENAYAVLLWDARESPAQSAVISLGEIERLSWIGALWRRLSQPDIGLPALTGIMIALFTWFTKRKEKREANAKQEQENKEKTEREDRERKEKREAEERDQHQRTWDLMLPQAYHLSLRYYIPMANATLTAGIYLAACRGTPQPSEQELLAGLFGLAQMQWQRLRMKQRSGGYHFKSRTAEALVEMLFQKHRYYFHMTAERYVTLTKFLKPFHSQYEIVDFEADRIAWDDSQKQFWQEFQQWVPGDDCKNDLIALGALQKLLTYESNRPFLNWYQEQPPAKLETHERALLESLSMDQLPDDSATPERVSAYLKEVIAGVKQKSPDSVHGPVPAGP